MKIKDVEKEVGISAHSIRFYEEMGLIEINRKPNSKYRNFSTADVKKLKEIKLFRSLGITMEEIKRYYRKEISLEELMEHQMQELQAQHEDMQLKVRLCEDIQQSRSPLVPYTVEKYAQIIEHKSEKLPYEQAGSLISAWNKQEFHKRRVLFLEACIAPIIFIFVCGGVSFLWNLKESLTTGTYISTAPVPALIISILITFLIVYSDYLLQKNFPGEFYEFRERGIYYLNQDSQKHLLKILLKGNLEEQYEYVAYEDIKVFKVWFTMVARVPINGGNAYRVDFFIVTTNDERIRIDTGIFGTSDEKVRITAEILKEKAQRVIDPYHILEHLEDDPQTFYEYLDAFYYQREYARIEKNRLAKKRDKET